MIIVYLTCTCVLIIFYATINRDLKLNRAKLINCRYCIMGCLTYINVFLCEIYNLSSVVLN